MTRHFDLVVVGGGAAGVFGALMAKEYFPAASVLIIEKTATLLAKVRISGGGRCNTTHACFDPNLLIKNYPRGKKELLGPFHHFQPKDTVAWFASRGVQLKQEEDGRMFPTTDSSETIINCLLDEAKKLGVKIWSPCRIEAIDPKEPGFQLMIKGQDPLSATNLLLATGSSSQGHRFAQKFGHTIETPVPSLFTFNIPDFPLAKHSGVSVPEVQVSIDQSALMQKGPLLITHFGLSGPAILKLSAWGARELHQRAYQFSILIDWVSKVGLEEAYEKILKKKESSPQKYLRSDPLFHLPRQLWGTLLAKLGFNESVRWCDLPNKKARHLASSLKHDSYQVSGKTTHKEEFVTCGGVCLKEVNFKTMESKLQPNLFFAGEILDIDGVTGGFNFQNAWTTAYLAGCAIKVP